MVSRPNTVMNQGIPAAGRSSGPSPWRSRSAARSATEWSKQWRSGSHVVVSRGTRSDHASSDSRTRARSVPNRCSTSSGSSTSPSSDTATSTRTSQDECGSSSIAKRTAPPSGSPSRESTTCVRPPRPPGSASTTRPSRSSKRAGAKGGRCGAWSGSPSAKSCSFTLMMSAKSVPKSSSSVNASCDRVSLRTSMWSWSPWPTKRCRAIESASFSSPSTGALRA